MTQPLTLMQAVDHLSDMAEINPHSSWILGIAKPFIFEDFSEEILWHNPNKILENKEIVKETFLTIYKWLKNLGEMETDLLKTPEVRVILKGIIGLAQEAIKGMDRYAVLFPNVHENFEQLPEYHQLIKFYSHRIERGSQRKEPKKEEEYSSQKYQFPDLESIRKDQQYEMLFLKSKAPLYNEKLLKDLNIIGNFSEFFIAQNEEQFFIRVKDVLEHQTCEGAKEIVERAMPHIDDFYKEAMHHKNRPFVSTLNKALMALRLATNAKQQGKEGEKTCLEYYYDFHFFLRLSMQVPGYRERMMIEQEDPFSPVLLTLTHTLCAGLFLRTSSYQDCIGLIRYFLERGKTYVKTPKIHASIPKELKIWVELVQSDNAIRGFLKFFPNGPLMKAFFHFQEHPTTFDPLLQYLPGQLFTYTHKEIHVTVLHLASPTIQEDLETCSLAEEFQGFLRSYQQGVEKDKHLLFNLQNRTLDSDRARCETLEKTAEQKEFSKVFFLASFPKTGELYLQNGEFEQMSGSPVFIETCLDHIFGEKENGFIFPSILNREEYKHFAKRALECVHREFFQSKTTLSQRERRDFIEFFYQLLMLKCIEEISPDSISFTCKDGVDTSPAQTAFFYASLTLFSGKQPDFEILLWLFFWPALSIRNRNIEPGAFHRSIQSLFYIHAQILENPRAVDAINGLFHPKMFPVNFPKAE